MTQNATSAATQSGADVVIVGGGVIGLSCAWTLASRGSRVAVVDPAPGHGAVWVAAGMLAPANEAYFGEERLIRLLMAGAKCWPGFATSLEEAAASEIGYEESGALVVARDPSDRAALNRLLEFRHSLGLSARRLGPSECRRLVPGLSPAICGGAETPGDGHVDNRLLVAALLSACRNVGVELVQARGTLLELDSKGSVRGLCTDTGSTIRTHKVVAAMGWQTPSLGGIPSDVLPEVRPVKGHILRLLGRANVVDRAIRGLVRGRSCYLVPRRDHSLVIGATVEEMGPDYRVQAGAVHGLLDDARSIVPGVDELELVECAVGLRPGTADNAPYIGWTRIPGFAVATGHYRNGILLAPITAYAIASLIEDEEPPEEILPFSPQAVTERRTPGTVGA